MKILLALLFVVSLPRSSPSAKTPCTGLPGSAMWFCVHNDRALNIRTWSYEDASNRHSIEVCDFTGRYTNVPISIKTIFSKQWNFKERLSTSLPLITFTPSPASLCKRWIIDAVAPGIEWELDAIRIWRTFIPGVIKEG